MKINRLSLVIFSLSVIYALLSLLSAKATVFVGIAFGIFVYSFITLDEEFIPKFKYFVIAFVLLTAFSYVSVYGLCAVVDFRNCKSNLVFTGALPSLIFLACCSYLLLLLFFGFLSNFIRSK